ncbi:HNH endonuclease [Campylobacter lari]|nr:HNH endonuclease [Campylobacter lari]
MENILNKDIYNHNKWIKPLLILIEYNQDDSEQREFIDLEQAHIEHILPKSYEKFYPHINKEIADNYLNSCCNLTLLKDKKNIDAGNKPFDKKIEIYKGEGKDKKQSSFLITQIIINNYEKKEITQWNEDSMKNRRKWFCNEIEKLFSIKIKENK